MPNSDAEMPTIPTEMRMGTWLKALVCLYWLVGTLDVAASLFLMDALPAGLRAWLDSRAQPPDLGEWLMRGWMSALLGALIAGSLGILRLENWGRWVFVVANAAMFASYPLLDAMVYTWFGGLFADLSMVLTGAILLAIFAPGSAGLFRSSPRDQTGH